MVTAREQDVDRLVLPGSTVTGEAVTLELRPASFATRALALALDLFVVFVLLMVVGFAGASAGFALDPAASAALSLVLGLLVMLGVPVTVETLTRGRSLGKLAAGLRVVRDDGGPIRFRHALIRGLLAVFEIYLTTGSVALFASLLSARGKRLGDMLAGTYVVRERAGQRMPPPVPMPPAMAAWAVGADLAPLPDSLAMAVRQFLGRTERLSPHSRVRLAEGLASDVARYTAPAPPPWASPEMFLAAVLAERRRRDLDRLGREAALRQARRERLGRVGGR